ncbi:MAG TPA: hypothetical protein VHT03_10715 [Rhizomicrobium sp.]|nr:hypothetical protein [Rhizomicrobium sp.]
MLDYILIGVSALALALQAVLGVLVSTRPPPLARRIYFEIGFVVIAVIGGLAVVIGAVRGLDSQSHLQNTVEDVRGTQGTLLTSNTNMSATIRGMADELRLVRAQVDKMVNQQIAGASPPAPVVPPPKRVLVRARRAAPQAGQPPQTGQQEAQNPQSAHIQFVQRNIVSTSPDTPYEAQVIIQTDQPINSAAFAIICDNELEKGEFFVTGQGVMMNVMYGVSQNKKAFILKFGFPAFTPDAPIVATLYSKHPIHVLEVRDIRGQP